MGVRHPSFVKSMGPQGASDSQNVQGLPRSVGYGFPWNLSSSLPTKALHSYLHIPRSKELWELCVLVPPKGVAEKGEFRANPRTGLSSSGAKVSCRTRIYIKIYGYPFIMAILL